MSVEAEIHLLNGPYLTVGGKRHDIPEGSKRLLAFIALNRGPVARRCVAGTLWPSCDDDRSAGNLRSALWRLRGSGAAVIECDKSSLSLAAQVAVDIDRIDYWAARIAAGNPEDGDFCAVAEKTRALDILPGCYDDWAIVEREQLRQRVLHALEAASRLSVSAGRFGTAVEAATAAVFCEPLRESAQRALIDAHLAEGNVVEARRAFARYAVLVERELRIEPPDDLRVCVGLAPNSTIRTRKASTVPATAAPSAARRPSGSSRR